MRVAILGCGYLGLELGRQLSAAHDVVGVRRSDAGLDAVDDAGLTAVRADVTDPSSLSAVPDVDSVVFAASAGGRDAAAAREVYVSGQRTVLDHFGDRDRTPDRYLYTSSTGVYGDHGGDWVDEETPLDPATPKANVLVTAEQVARERAVAAGIDWTIARIAGIYGPERYRIDPYLEGPVVAGYRNVVHRDDAAGAVAHLLTEDRARGEAVLVCDDEPVSRWDFADWLAAACGRDPPEKQTVDEKRADDGRSMSRRLAADKRCSNQKLRDLGYSFSYPTFREGYESAVAAYRDGDSGAS